MKFYPCIADKASGRVNKIVGPLGTFEEADAFLRKNYPNEFRILDACAQPENMAYFTDPTYEYYVGKP